MRSRPGTAAAFRAQLDAVAAVDDPVGWSTSQLGTHLWSRQRQILESVRDHRHTAVQAANGVGKSFTAAAAVLWWIASRPIGSAFAVTTATTAKQVEGILWREVGRHHRRAELPGWITGGTDPGWKIEGELVAIGRKPADDDLEGLLGFHARYMLVVLDEASGVPEALFDAADSMTTTEDSRVLAIGNPLVPGSPFAKACAPGSGWNRIKISAFETPAFTGETVPEEVLANLSGPTWVRERKRRWGEHSPAYIARVLGEFPAADERALIDPAWIIAAQERTLGVEQHAEVLGVDVGGGGGSKSDRTVIYRARGGWLRRVLVSQGHDTMQTAGEVARRLRSGAVNTAHVDTIGVGQGVYDALREDGHPVQRFRASERPRDPQQFANRRAETYWQLREAFKQGEIDLDPADEDLAAELGALRWKLNGRHGQIQIESKDELRKRTKGLSPDLADAACIAHQAGRRGGLRDPVVVLSDAQLSVLDELEQEDAEWERFWHETDPGSIAGPL